MLRTAPSSRDRRAAKEIIPVIKLENNLFCCKGSITGYSYESLGIIANALTLL